MAKVLPHYRDRVPERWLKDGATPDDPEHTDVPPHLRGNFPSSFIDASNYDIADGATEVVGTIGIWTSTSGNPQAPFELADLSPAVVASPLTLWAAGSYMRLADQSAAHWDGGAWVFGMSPGAMVDMDADGKPDTQAVGAQGDGKVSVTVDADSINVDITGDDKAELVIPTV